MADSLPTDGARADRPDRTAKIEELLLSGLDHYFAGQYEEAVSVWTRVLFFDRGHARARAYIERARAALAEHQRESEVLIQLGVAAFEEGQAAEARELLSSAVARGGPHEVALAVLDRLDRLETATPGVPAPRVAGQPDPRRRRARVNASSSRAWIAGALLLVAAVAVGLYATFTLSNPAGSIVWRSSAPPAAAVRPSQDALPMPGPGELALDRARALSSSGHLKEALVVLERINLGDPVRADTERLRAEIQASLLAGLPPLATARRAEGR
jgi:tetratricopeptide (TPR) repeat protein